jgi:DNA-binding GntR family transcriptional regulator
MVVEPDFPTTTRSFVVARLRNEIIAGALPYGTRLRQADVAARFKISTTPVREAFRELATLGLVEIEPHRGAVVLRPTGEELAQIFEVRTILEPISVAWSAQRIQADKLEQAQKLVDLMKDPASADAAASLNRQFHSIIVESCGNRHLGELVLNLLDRSTPYVMRVVDSSEQRRVHQTSEHMEILAACEARDPKRAYAASLRHLTRLPLDLDLDLHASQPSRPDVAARWLPAGLAESLGAIPTAEHHHSREGPT